MGINVGVGIGSANINSGVGVGTQGISINSESPPAYEGPLDLVPGAALAASSERAMSSASRGDNALNLRRESDDALMDFETNETTGIVSQSAITTWSSGDAFSRILYDQSGNGNDFSYTAFDNQQPRWSVVSTFSAIGGTNPDAPNTLILNSPATIVANGDITVFSVCSFDPVDALLPMNILYCEAAAGDYAYLYVNPSDGEVYYEVFEDEGVQNAIWVGSAGALNGLHVVEFMQSAAGTPTLLIDGAEVSLTLDSGDPVAFSDTCFFQIANACKVQNPQESNSFFLEWIAYLSVLSAGDRLLLRENIATYYGITLP